MRTIVELEGKWEDILSHASQLKGRRVRVWVLSEQDENGSGSQPVSLKPENQAMLEWLSEMEPGDLTENELAILDEMEAFLKAHPVRFGKLEEKR